MTMGYAEAIVMGDRIVVRTVKTPGVNDFDFMLAASKAVVGGRYHNRNGIKYWHYPLSIATCKQLRGAFGSTLRVGNDLAQWYLEATQAAAAQVELGTATEATLEHVPAQFAAWLRGYQRAGAVWIANGYRGCGLVADKPGVGKTPETLAALLEADVRGPVLVVCPKASVRSVWGLEARRHLRGVPVYLCRGNRKQRERVLGLFAKHMAKEPNRLRIVVVVAEMLRVELGDPCFTWELKDPEAQEVPGKWLEDGTFKVDLEAIKYKNKISGMCSQRFKSLDGSCRLHVQVPPPEGSSKSSINKWKVPVGFMYPQLFDRYLLGGGWDWIILDEAHRLLGSLTIAKANLMGRALKLLPERSGRRYALTGTPFGKGGRIQGMFGTLHWLWPDEHTSFWKWAAQVFEIDEKVVNRFGKTVKQIVGPKGLRPDASAAEEAQAREDFLASLGPRVLRRTKEEVMSELPPKTYSEVVCEMDPLQAKQYQELLDYAEISTPGGSIMANGALPMVLRSQQLANGALTKGPSGKAQFTQSSGKLDRLWENLDARGIIDGTHGDKLVIASRFNEFLDSVQAMLCRDKVGFLRIDGGSSEKQRERVMNRWQQGLGPERVMLVNVKAAGISINLDAADELHIMDEDPDPGVNEQLEDRIHRASRVHKVFIFYYRTEGTLDYQAAHNVEYRRRVQHAVLDGRRGIEYVRELLSEALEGVD